MAYTVTDEVTVTGEVRPASSRTRPAPGWVQAGILCGYALLTLVMTWPLALQFTTAIPGDSFDGWQNYWNLWWLRLALVDRVQTPFFTDLLYYPSGVGLYFHTLNPLNGLMTLPLQLSGGLLIAYNSVVLLAWTLSGYGAYLLARWVLAQADIGRGDTQQWAAVIGGLIFTFAPVHMAHLLGHMQVMALQWLPFYMLSLLRGMARQRRGKPWQRDGLLAGLFLIFAGLCDWYFVLYLFLWTGFVIAAAWVQVLFKRQALRRLIGNLIGSLLPGGLAGLVFLIGLAPVLYPMVREAVRFDFMVRPAQDLFLLSASLLDFVTPNRLHTLWRPESFAWPGNQVAPVSERTIGIGYVALGLALLGAWRRRALRVWLLGGVVFMLLAMGPVLHFGSITQADIPDEPALETITPYTLANQLIPFMRISRSVSRFAIMVQLCVAVAAAGGMAWLLSRMRSRLRYTTLRDSVLRHTVVGLVAGLALAEYWVAPYPMSPPDTPGYYSELALASGMESGAEESGAVESSRDGDAVLNLPMNFDRPGYLLYQTVHQRPLTVAYISRNDPRTYTERVPFLQHLRHLGPDILADDPAAVGLRVLHDLDVGYVILDNYKMPGGLERDVTTALTQAVFAGETPIHQDERLTVYAVPDVAESKPYLALGPLHWGPLMNGGQDETGARFRSVQSGPAVVRLHHTGSDARVALRYRTEPGASATIAVAGAPEPIALGPADSPATITFAVPGGEFTLQTAGRVDVLEIGLVETGAGEH